MDTAPGRDCRPAKTESARSAPPMAVISGLPPIMSQPGQNGSAAANTTTKPLIRGTCASRSKVQ